MKKLKYAISMRALIISVTFWKKFAPFLFRISIIIIIINIICSTYFVFLRLFRILAQFEDDAYQFNIEWFFLST